MHDTLLNVGPTPSSNASTSENVRPVALNSSWVQFPLLRPSKPVGASVTALTCGPEAPSSAWVATARPGSCAAGSSTGALDEQDATSKDAGNSSGSLYSGCAFLTLFFCFNDTATTETDTTG